VRNADRRAFARSDADDALAERDLDPTPDAA